jgi:hypothetical protein
MMTARKPPSGDLSTFSAFKDKLTVGLVALAVAAMWFFVNANQKQVESFHADIASVRASIAEVRDRLNADQNASSGQAARFGAQGEEALRRLDGIDKKLDGIAAKAR